MNTIIKILIYFVIWMFFISWGVALLASFIALFNPEKPPKKDVKNNP